MTVTVEHATDLRRVYQTIFDAFAISTSEITDTLKGINTRYARELCGTLQQANLIILTEDGEGSDAWQVNDPGTYDSHEWSEAAQVIDKWLGIEAPRPPKNATSTTGSGRSSLKSGATGPHPCACGCGEVLTSRSVYRPGHDARHAGAVGRQVAEIMNGGHDEGDQIEIDRLYATLGSDKLREKAARIADKQNQRNLKAAKPEYPDVDGIVRVGKNEYPAKREASGNVRYLKPGASDWQSASKTAAKTFQEG